MARGISVKNFRDLMEHIQPVELDEKNMLPDIKGGYYDVDVDVGLFTTTFTQGDVDDFLSFFMKNPAVPSRQYLGSLVTQVLTQWFRDNPTRCPYEPFLWALKIHDNYVGSIKGAPIPDYTLLDPVAEALKSKWIPEYASILKNIIINWDWYQPIHVALKLYELLDDFNDSEIDEKISRHWLYNYMYSNNAFKCLLKKKKTDQNIIAIMDYISRDSYDDKRIEIYKGTRKSFVYYARSMTPEEDRFAYSYYRNALNYCSRKARQEAFEQVWATGDGEGEMSTMLSKLIATYRTAKSTVAKQDAAHDFRTFCLDGIQKPQEGKFSYIIQETVEDELIREVIDVFDKTEITFSTQHILKEMLKSPSQHYRDYISKKFQRLCRSGITNVEGLLYASAYCNSGHPELLNEILNSFFVEGKGFIRTYAGQSIDVVRYIVFSLRNIYSEQYNDAIEKIVRKCLADETNEISLALVNNCKKIFSQSTITCYPIAFDQVLDFLVMAVKNSDANAPRYATAVLGVIERISSVANRNRYYDILMTIHRTVTPQLINARREANQIITRLFGAASV